MAFPFGFTGASAAGACPIPKRRKPPDEAAFRRVASKGVYAGGGSIAEGVPERKFVQNSGLVQQVRQATEARSATLNADRRFASKLFGPDKKYFERREPYWRRCVSDR
jgi:hypothetical protein